MIIVLLIITGGDLGKVLQFLAANNPGIQQGPAAQQPVDDQQDDELAEFVSVILRDTEIVWSRLFAEMGLEYRKPTLVLFRGNVVSACGFGSAASGPFYCPGDEKLYVDLAFYQELQDRFGAPGDFAQAYVIAHEVGHHVQKQLGTMDKVHALQQRVDKVEANELSVRLELQADFLAGVWAHHAQVQRQILEKGDIEEGLNAASSIGDDTLQKQAQGYVVKDAFTHGTSAQRVRWFRKGLETGELDEGDTFDAQSL
jgi:predicted metalloprotease